MKLSIIACACSQERFDDILDLIDSIAKQTIRVHETSIIIDGNRNLYYRLKKHLNENPAPVNIYLNPEHSGLSTCRNIGIENSSGDILAFVDDDAVLDPSWASGVLDSFEVDDVWAATGDIRPLWEGEGMKWFPRELYWMISCSYSMTPDERTYVERGFGTNMAFRRCVFDLLGPFEKRLGIVSGKRWMGGEETLVFLKIAKEGKKVLYNPEMSLSHKIKKERLRISEIIKRSFGGGYSVALLNRIWDYRMPGSKEQRYLRSIIYEFYPKKARELLLKRSKETLRQMLVTAVVLTCEACGYAYGLAEGLLSSSTAKGNAVQGTTVKTPGGGPNG